MGEQSILSVGIDIGTSTTQVVFSKLTMDNTASYFAVPHISITDKEVVYKSDVYITPLKTQTLIDAEAVRDIVAREFSKAGFTPQQTQTGAVIITGESARKENASAVLEKLSDFAGEFVVSTAGPDLESVVAGKGSGASAYSQEYSTTVLNLDIGGGTTNAVLFDCGEVIAKGCVDIGGRLIKFSENGAVTYISDSARKIAESVGVHINVGDTASTEILKKVTDKMSELLADFAVGKRSALLDDILTFGSTTLEIPKAVRVLCFSGGVADCVYTDPTQLFKFGDIGELLGKSIRNGSLFADYKVIKGSETIRATVVGAGTYTTSVSGSTIDYSEDLFPLKNVPVLCLNSDEQQTLVYGETQTIRDKVHWFMEQSDCDRFVLALDGFPNPSYSDIVSMARILSEVLDEELKKGEPIIIVLKHDMAKALGQAIKRTGTDRKLICIDSVKVEENDFVDMGSPMMNGLVIPVVVKTLIFG